MNNFRRIVLTLGALFLLFIFVWISLTRIKQASLVHIKDSLQTVTKTTHEALNIWIKHRKNDVKEFAQDPTLIKLTQQLLSLHATDQVIKDSQVLQDIRRVMQKKMAIHDDIGFFIISPDFTNIASMRSTNLGVKNLIYQKRGKLIEQIFLGQSLFIPPIQSDVPLMTDSGELVEKLATIFIGTPIKDDHEKIIAVLTIRLELSSDFTNITQLGRIGESGETYAFDSVGTMITNSRFDHQLQKIGLVKEREQGMLSIKIADPGGNMLKGFKPTVSIDKLPLTFMVQQALSGQQSDKLVSYRDYRGVPVFGTWLWDNTLGFGLTTEIDVEEALLPYYNTRLSILLFALLVIILSLGAQLMLIRLEQQAHLELKRSNDELELKVAERTKELEKLINKDSLTNIGNRRIFDLSIQQEWRRATRNQQPLSLLIIDIDYFKQFNDHFGHQQGDVCLVKVAKILSQMFSRTGEVVARYGGEEFAVILPNIQLEQAIVMAENFRIKMVEEKILHPRTKIPDQAYVTISIGVATMVPEVNQQYGMLIEAADNNLYRAKSQGRNTVVG